MITDGKFSVSLIQIDDFEIDRPLVSLRKKIVIQIKIHPVPPVGIFKPPCVAAVGLIRWPDAPQSDTGSIRIDLGDKPAVVSGDQPEPDIVHRFGLKEIIGS